MKAFVVSKQDTNQFVVVEQEKPRASGRDVLVEVKAISMNPVDTKVRNDRPGQVLGYDASGVVVAAGDDVTHYKPGDEVFYAGTLSRAGSNSEFQLVDERIVGRKPSSLSHTQSAAIPLTALTAWEGLYEQLKVKKGGTLLVLNGAGGVGSLVIQMAKKLSNMTVIATASRDETKQWTTQMGADHVINHRENMPQQLKALGFEQMDYIYCCYNTEVHFEAMTEMIAPSGHIVSIVNSGKPLAIENLFGKRVSFSWEFMFTKPMFQTSDMDTQREILNEVSRLLDEGTLVHTLTEEAGVLTPESLAAAHRRQESGKMFGKLALQMP